MNLRRENEEQWERLNKMLDGKIKTTVEIVTKGAAPDSIKKSNTGKPVDRKVLDKFLIELSTKAPDLFKLFVKKFGKPEEEASEEATAEEESEDINTSEEPPAEEEAAEPFEEPTEDSLDEPVAEEQLSQAEPTVGGEEDPTVDNTTSPLDAQANTTDDHDRMQAIEQELHVTSQLLQEIQQIAHEQGILSEEEIANIINPLRQETESLLSNLQSRQPRQEAVGPERQVATAERSLEHPANTFSGKSDTEQDIVKERGWHGDPSGHAEAARERWEQEGVSPGGDSRKKPGIADTAAKEIKKVPKNAIRRLASNVGNAIGDIASDLTLEAAGSMAGWLALYWATGGRVSPTAIMRTVGKSGKSALKNAFKLPRIKRLADNYPSIGALASWAAGGAAAAGAAAAAKTGAKAAAKTGAKAAAKTGAKGAVSSKVDKK